MDAPVAPAIADDIEVESNGTLAADPAPVTPPVVSEPDAEAIEAEAAEPELELTEPEPPKAKPSRSIQAKIDQVIARQKSAERERDDYRARLDAIERERAPRQPEQPREPQYTRAKPTEAEIGSKYPDYPAYIEDLTDWKLEQREVQQQRQAHQRAIAQRHEATATKFSERIAKAEQADPDYWSKIDPAVANLRPSTTLQPGERATALNAIADMIFDSDYSTELMASLKTTDIQRLSTLPPAQLFREMGRLEASVMRPPAAQSGPAAKTPVISQAPPPIKPVGTTASTGEVNPLEDDLDIDEHIKVMNARDKQGRFKSR